MLPQLNLDDRLFEQWMTEARKAIQKRYPEWTDENAHDPGITLLEMFSWIGEMQQYYLSRITSGNEKKFLAMLGTKPLEASRAGSTLLITGVERNSWLPAGIKIYADTIPFETTESVLLTGANIDKVIVRSDSEANDYTSSNRNEGVSFPAFGRAARKGNRLYIGFDQPLSSNQSIAIHIRLFEDYPVAAGPFDSSDSFIPSADITWQYYGERSLEANNGEETITEGWIPAKLESDETNNLSFSGRVKLKMESDMKPLTIHPANDRPRYWISCTLVDSGYELPPKIQQINVNSVHVAQQESFSIIREFNGTGRPDQYYVLEDRLAYSGIVSVQIRHNDGYWLEWDAVERLAGHSAEETVYTLNKDTATFRTTVLFGDGTAGKAPSAVEANIRIVAYDPEFEEGRWLGGSNGLPWQTYSIPQKPVIGETFLLQTAVLDPNSERPRWYDWKRVDDFDRTTSHDRHYVLDCSKGEIRFGDHERGLIPETEAFPNIRITAIQVGGGASGNVKQHKIKDFSIWPDLPEGISATNVAGSEGGRNAESIEEAKQRAMHEIKQQNRAVTDEDYERLTKLTPGVRVARVKTLTLYKPGMEDYPRTTVPAQTTVVVVPFSEEKIPIPGDRFLYNVKQHLEKHRLITTELNIIAPEYVKITVHAVIITEPYFKKDSTRIIDSLNRLLQPLDHDRDKGWVFGRPVYKGDIYGLINQMKGVAYIQDLWLEAEGKGVVKDKNGDILLPPHGLVYSGEHQIECISRTDL